MALVPILGQPLKLAPYLEPRCECSMNDPYCYLHQPLDPVRMQWKQTPCESGWPTPVANNLTCDPVFNLGAELITNGGFTGSAADWTLVDATYGSDQVCFDGAATGLISQTILTPLVPGHKYSVAFTFSGITTGNCVIEFDGTPQYTVTSDGTYVVSMDYFSGANTIIFAGDTNFDGCLDNVSVKEFSACWAYDNTDFFITPNTQTLGNSIIHIPGTATTFTDIDALIQDDYYQVIMRVQNRTQGFVQMFAGDVDLLANNAITQNGIFTQYLNGNQAGASVGDPINFNFYMSDDFDGTVEYVYAYKMRLDFICTLLDMNGVPIADLSNKLVYHENYVTLSFAGLQGILDYDSNPILYGCYKISVIDPCGDPHVTNGDFSDPDPQVDWTEINYFVNGIFGGQANAVSTGAAVVSSEIYQPVASGLEENRWYVATYRYKASFIDAGTTIDMNVGATPLATVNNVLTTWQTFVSAPFQLLTVLAVTQLEVVMGDDTAGNIVSLDDVAIYAIDQYITNCINYQLTHEGTYLVMARGEFIPRSFGFGFLFRATNLYLFFFIQRLALCFRKPKYPTKFEAGAYSTGTHYKSFASSEKVYEVVFDPIGEIEHDCIALMIQCPEFYIQGTDGVLFSSDAKYICITEEYVPNYDDGGSMDRYDSSIEVQHITDIVKISNI